jgi:hypothetical protein
VRIGRIGTVISHGDLDLEAGLHGDDYPSRDEDQGDDCESEYLKPPDTAGSGSTDTRHAIKGRPPLGNLVPLSASE